MREHRLAGDRHGRLEDGAGVDLFAAARHHDVEVVPGEGDVRAVDVVPALDVMRGPAERIEAPGRRAGMGDHEPAFLIQRHAVGTGMAAAHLDEQADLARRAVAHQRQAPDRIAARHADIEHGLGLVHHQPVGARHGVHEHRQPARRVVAIDATGRVVQAGLALIGEIEIAVGSKEQVVHALEAFRAARLKQGRDLAGAGIEQEDAALVIGDEDAAVPVDLEPVRPAVIFGHQRPFACGADAEDAAERNVGDVEIAGTIEARPLEEGIEQLPHRIGIAPRRAPRLAELLRQAGELGRPNGLGHSVHDRFPRWGSAIPVARFIAC